MTAVKRKLAGLVPVAIALACSWGCNDDTSEPPANQDDGGSELPDSGNKPDSGKPNPQPDGGTANDAGDEPDTGIDAGPNEDAAVPDDADVPDAEQPLSLGGLTVDTTREEQGLDLFGVPGHRFWIEVSDSQLQSMNQQGQGGGNGDIYVPGGEASATYADHVLIQNAADESVADYGKTEVKLVGESTFRHWDSNTIPNVRIDADEFEADKRMGGFEHIRLNNSLVGSIFREQIAHRVFRELDYPALRASYAFLGSNVWGTDTWVPMTLVEVYKRKFCDDNAELIGGTCDNMWEFYGDIGDRNGGGGGPIIIDVLPGDKRPLPEPGPGPDPNPGTGGGGVVPEEWCQLSECDNTRMEEFIQAIEDNPPGPGFKAALEPFMVWERWHQFQCLTWMLWIGDDPIHNANNNLIIQRDDGRFMWEPYSVDISAGQEWYQNTPLVGDYSSIARGCQRDPECWADTIAACEDLIVRFDELDPELIVDETTDTLTGLGMMRSGDDGRAEEIRNWYVKRQEDLPTELERYRYLPDENGNCPDGLEQCGDGGCGTPEDCVTRNCGFEQTYCTSLDRCVYGYEECPECPEETPFYCDLNSECMLDQQTCHDSCALNNPGYVWCEQYGSCVPEEECGNGDPDGGIVPPPPFIR